MNSGNASFIKFFFLSSSICLSALAGFPAWGCGDIYLVSKAETHLQEYVSLDELSTSLDELAKVCKPEQLNKKIVSTYKNFRKVIPWSHLEVLLDHLSGNNDVPFFHKKSRERIEFEILQDQLRKNWQSYAALPEAEVAKFNARVKRLDTLKRTVEQHTPLDQLKLARKTYRDANLKLGSFDSALYSEEKLAKSLLEDARTLYEQLKLQLDKGYPSQEILKEFVCRSSNIKASACTIRQYLAEYPQQTAELIRTIDESLEFGTRSLVAIKKVVEPSLTEWILNGNYYSGHLQANQLRKEHLETVYLDPAMKFVDQIQSTVSASRRLDSTLR